MRRISTMSKETIIIIPPQQDSFKGHTKTIKQSIKSMQKNRNYGKKKPLQEFYSAPSSFVVYIGWLIGQPSSITKGKKKKKKSEKSKKKTRPEDKKTTVRKKEAMKKHTKCTQNARHKHDTQSNTKHTRRASGVGGIITRVGSGNKKRCRNVHEKRQASHTQKPNVQRTRYVTTPLLSRNIRLIDETDVKTSHHPTKSPPLQPAPRPRPITQFAPC